MTTTHSRRTISKNLNDMINRLYARYGKSIQWPAHEIASIADNNVSTGNTRYWGDGYIDTGEFLLSFRTHGNQYAGYVEIYSYDQKLIKQVKEDFPEDFPNRLIIKEGI